MGQRSQIYIAFNKRGDDSKARSSQDKFLVARYYQWNFGSQMVSRVAGLIEWLEEYKDCLDWKTEHISRIADINFDFKDVVISSDIIKEYADYGNGYSAQEYIFEGQDNNDGKCFISVEQDGTIKYAFTDWNISEPLTAKEYMLWGDYDSEENESSNYARNVKTIACIGTLMTNNDLCEFLSTPYCNVPIV